MKDDELKEGDRIAWTYEHTLNSVSHVMITKHGTFLRKVKHSSIWWQYISRRQMAVVRFDRQKQDSQVPFEELERA